MTEAWLRPSKFEPLPPEREGAPTFVEESDGYWATGQHERRWHITRAVTGWRLEFRDPRDRTSTFAGIHPTLAKAIQEAAR